MQFSIEEQQLAILKVKRRDYKCPCGKAYLSNPALFTHVKLKHQGYPPGQLSKPILEKGKKGRPPIYPIKTSKAGSSRSYKIARISGRSIIEQYNSDSRFYDKMLKTFKTLIFTFEPTSVSGQIFSQFECFRIVQAYFDEYSINKVKVKSKLSLIQGIRQFYNYSQIICEFKFQIDQIYLLLVLIIQYVIDQCNYIEVLWEAPMDFLLSFFNQFIIQYQSSYHFEELQLYKYQIFKPAIVIEFLCCLYNWMKYQHRTERNVYLKQSKNY